MKHFRTNISLLFVVTICCNLLVLHSGFAAEMESTPMMQVTPIIEELSLNPSSETNKSIIVTNQGSGKLGIKVYVAPYSITKETGTSDFETFSETTQIYHWIKIQDQNSTYQDKAEFFIGPGKAKTINYQIKVPESAPGGSQHACIFIETIPEDHITSNSIPTVSRTAVKVFADISGQTNKDAEVDTLDSSSSLVMNGQVFVKTAVRNTGNIDVKPTLTLKINDLSGETVFENTAVAMVFPENTSQMEIYWPDAPTFGIYHLVAAVNILGKNQLIEKQIIILPLWFIIIVLLVIVAIIFIIRYRKNTKKFKNSIVLR